MDFETFKLERVQSLYENSVEYNLTESGVHPFTLRELLTPAEIEQVLDCRIGYGQTNGTVELRRAVSRLYPGTDEDNVLVTHGAIEANLVACLALLSPGEELVYMLPNYQQIWGLARGLGVKVRPFTLRRELNWQPDLDELRSLVTDKTRMIAVCNPNNPTGAVLGEEAMAEIIRLAESVGAWVYADEIYRGEEIHDEELTPTFNGRYEKTIVASSLSKAWALAGLRIGWLVGPKREIEECWARRDYTTISTARLSNLIAELALKPERIKTILARSRKILRANLGFFDEWAADRGELFSYIPPQAGGFVFAAYNLKMNSTALSDGLRREKSVFLVPGDAFGLDNHIRIGIGSEKEYFLAGLERFGRYLEEII